MIKENYELNIISHHPKFNGQTLEKHFVDNIQTIGVWGEEPFEIEVKNNTSQKVQVRLSLDGTDILTVTPATKQPSGAMWLLDGFAIMKLSAWPETSNTGARFVFGKTLDSVAANTHGDMSNKGIIAAAFFTEGYVEPRRTYPSGLLGGDFTMGKRSVMRGSDFRSETKGARLNSLECSDSFSEICESGPGIGAGETIKQAIVNAKGLTQPVFDRVVSLRYLWWDDLKIKLEKHGHVNHGSGFVEQTPQKIANLGNTPRIERVRSV